MAAKCTRFSQQIALLWYLVAESCTTYSSW